MQLRRFRISMILEGLPAIVRASEVVSGHLLQVAGSLAFVKFAYIFLGLVCGDRSCDLLG